jgi:teichuronic acid biosynthesis glycosyltransferase TuaG
MHAPSAFMHAPSADRLRVGDATSTAVICTAKNAASTIERTIRSILAQDLQNWEMIIVDDGSTDNTVSIVRAFAQADPRITLVATGGIGRGRSLNLAIAEAKADLVANIDADDESHPDRLRCQLEAMLQHPEFAIVATECVRVYGSASAVWPEIDAGALFEVKDVTRVLASNNPICHSSAMMRKAAIIGLGGYNEETLIEDYDLWVRLVGAGHRLGRIQLPLVAKRIHPDQAFLYRRRLHYLATSVVIQVRAIRALGSGDRYIALIPLRFVWGLLPVGLRLRLRPRRW